MLVRRVLLGLLALGVCVWFALSVKQAHEVSHASAIAGSATRISAGQARAATAALDEARSLNPDQEVNILRGEIALESGQVRDAQRILDEVTRAEPQNLEAWLWLAHSAGGDRRLFYRALVKVRQLEPIVRAPH